MVYLSHLFQTFLEAAKGFLSQLNWVDIFVITILLRTGYIGLRKGLFIEIVKTLGLILGLVVSVTQVKTIGNEISRRLNMSQLLSDTVAFGAILLSVYLGIRLIGFLLGKILKIEGQGLWSRLWGFWVGIVRGAILASCLLTATLLTGSGYLTESIQHKSLLAPPLVTGGSSTYQTFERLSAPFGIGSAEKPSAERASPQ